MHGHYYRFYDSKLGENDIHSQTHLPSLAFPALMYIFYLTITNHYGKDIDINHRYMATDSMLGHYYRFYDSKLGENDIQNQTSLASLAFRALMYIAF